MVESQLSDEVLVNIDRCAQITTFSKVKQCKFCGKKDLTFAQTSNILAELLNSLQEYIFATRRNNS